MEDPMDHFVNLEQLPADFAIPPKFQDRLEFDDKAHKLIFHGYMSKTDFDHLSSITNDWRFRRSLEELFRQCTPDGNTTPRGVGRVLANFGQLFSRK
jgi:hypothetical protein